MRKESGFGEKSAVLVGKDIQRKRYYRKDH